MNITPEIEWFENGEVKNEPLLLTSKYYIFSMENPMETQATFSPWQGYAPPVFIISLFVHRRCYFQENI